MTLNSTRVRLCSGRSHQPGFGCQHGAAVRLAADQHEGPGAHGVAGGEVLLGACVRSALRVALFRSAQARDMMPQPVISSRKMGFGRCVSNSTVPGETMRTSFTEAKTAVMFDPWPRARS
jgi:hypothetical protein